MIKPRLIKELKDSKKYIFYIVALQCVVLLSQIAIVVSLSSTIAIVALDNFSTQDISLRVAIIIVALLVRLLCEKQMSKFSYLAAVDVKRHLRNRIFEKMLSLGSSYSQVVPTSKVLQVATEGIEQLEIYFGKYLPQLFFSLIAPIVLFVTLFPISWKASVVLLVCVPLIPLSIVLVQKIAGRLFSKYWGIYTNLGDSFLENLQGMTTLKVYSADAHAALKMDEEASRFRKITMRVLTMQLNSTSIMDIMAYGAAAIGIAIAATQYLAAEIDLQGALCITLLSAEFFLPLRLLGSYFHIAMNGMAASDKIFEILDLPEIEKGKLSLEEKNIDIYLEDVSFSYDECREILSSINMTVKQNSFVAIVGESGCGKSTIAKILTGMNRGYSGNIALTGKSLTDIDESSLHKHVVRVPHNSHIFKCSLRENLLMGNSSATDKDMLEVLEKVNLKSFFEEQNGLDTPISEDGQNLSGGQKQRLAIARALLKDAPVYIFDEATSNIDIESEEIIMDIIRDLSKEKTIILISHRLANVVKCDCIYFLQDGKISESGSHSELLGLDGNYAKIYRAQQDLERFGRG